MKKSDQNRLSMWRAVRQHLDAHSETWSSSKPFVQASEALTRAIDQSRAALEVQSTGSRGISGDRLALADQTVKQVLSIARSTRVFAIDQRNEQLLHAMEYSRFSLLRLSQNKMNACLRCILLAARPYREALLEYGVPEDAWDSAAEAVLALEQMQSKVRRSITAQKAVTASLPSIVEAGRLAMLKLDFLVHLFESTDPVFTSGFRTARRIVNNGFRHEGENTKAA